MIRLIYNKEIAMSKSECWYQSFEGSGSIYYSCNTSVTKDEMIGTFLMI